MAKRISARAQRLIVTCDDLGSAADCMDEVARKVARTLEVLLGRTDRGAGEGQPHANPSDDAVPREFASEVCAVVRDVDSAAKRAESIVPRMRHQIEALNGEYGARLVRGAEHAQHSADLKALRTCRAQLRDLAEELWVLPEMQELNPNAVPTMNYTELQELLESVYDIAVNMRDSYRAVVEALDDIELR